MKMLRRNVLIDLGPAVNVLGSTLIETPDVLKRMNAKGKILSVGPKCLKLDPDMVGQEVIIETVTNQERVLLPRHAEAFGLKPHWHAIAHEDKISLLLESRK